MTKREKIVVGLMVTVGVLRFGIKACDAIETALQKMVEQKQEEAVDKVVDDFVTAAVTCRQFTIDSKHNGRATVRIVVD